jgi:NH3-dependent NAD+ synthetase
LIYKKTGLETCPFSVDSLSRSIGAPSLHGRELKGDFNKMLTFAKTGELFGHRFPEAGSLRRGNAMARARMIVLYDQSEAFRGLVVARRTNREDND